MYVFDEKLRYKCFIKKVAIPINTLINTVLHFIYVINSVISNYGEPLSTDFQSSSKNCRNFLAMLLKLRA